MTVTQGDPGVKPSERRRKGKARGADQGEGRDAREAGGDAGRGVVEEPFRCVDESVIFRADLSFGARLTVVAAQSIAYDGIEIRGRNRDLRERRGKVRGGEPVLASVANLKRWLGELERAGVTSRKFDPQGNRRLEFRFAMRTGPNSKVDPSWPTAEGGAIFRAIWERAIFRTTISDEATMTLIALLSYAKGRREFPACYRWLAEKLKRPIKGRIKKPSARTMSRWVAELVEAKVITHDVVATADGSDHTFVILVDVDPNSRARLGSGEVPGSDLATSRLGSGEVPGSDLATLIENKRRQPFFENGGVENDVDNALTLPSPGCGACSPEAGDATASEAEDRDGDTHPAPPIKEGTGAEPEWPPDSVDDAEHAADILLASLPPEWTHRAEAGPIEKKTGGCAAKGTGGARIEDEPTSSVGPGAGEPVTLAIYRPGADAELDDFAAGCEDDGVAQGPGPFTFEPRAGETPEGFAARWTEWADARDEARTGRDRDESRGGEPDPAGPARDDRDKAAGEVFEPGLRDGETPAELVARWLRAQGGGAQDRGGPEGEPVARGLAYVAGETPHQIATRWLAWDRARGGEAIGPGGARPQRELVMLYREHLKHRPGVTHFGFGFVADETPQEFARRWTSWEDASRAAEEDTARCELRVVP